MRIHLVRHGETRANLEGIVQGQGVDEPLNSEGLAQARALAARFRAEAAQGLHVDAVYASPLRRARETAEIVAAALGRPRVGILEGFREISWGEHQGKPAGAAIEAILDAWRHGDLSARAPGGETPDEAWARASRDLERLLREHPHDTLVVVGHGRVNKIVLSMLVHQDLHHMEEFPQRNGAFTVLDHESVSSPEWTAPLRGSAEHLRALRAMEERAG